MTESIFLSLSRQDLSDLVISAAREALAEQTSPTPPPGQIDDELLTRAETAALLRITLPTLYCQMKSGKLPFKRVGRRVLFSRREVLAAISTSVRKGGRV